MRWVLSLLVLAGASGCHEQAPAPAPEPLTIAAAASLRHVMPSLVEAWSRLEKEPLPAVTYGASGDLQKQVEGGAPIDVVVFASARPVDALLTQGLLLPGTRAEVARNALVLIGPPDESSPSLSFESLGMLPETERVAIGDPGAVPAGEYAKALLEENGAWSGLKGQVVFAGDVAAVLAYARRGEVAAAVVYRTDVLGPGEGLRDLRVHDEVSSPEGPAVVHVTAAVTSRGRSFAAFLVTDDARAIWERFGFGLP